jgi:cation diffusion facilitator CzcD-associated flavoprotein CzcO
VCIIGAGSSGIAACQILNDREIPFDCFEKGSEVGGNWRYLNDNGMSSSYESLFINTSRRHMEYRSLQMPSDLPDYPHHTQIAAYFDDYVDHFGLREHITFRTEVVDVEPIRTGSSARTTWKVTLDDGTSHSYDAVLVANGHHWAPHWPEPPFPGEFSGRVMHAHDYKSSAGFEHKHVLVLGIGNSACDIACETSRVSRMTYLSMRRGAHVIPKYLLGRPTDELGTQFTTRLPLSLQRWGLKHLLKLAQGDLEHYGLPKPDHKLLEAHPTISSELLGRIGHGRITPKPNIERLDGNEVRFADGSAEGIDVIVYASGYKISFPFFSPDVMKVDQNRMRLYRRVVHPDLTGLYFIGLIQPLGAIMPLAEAQAKWVADILEGKLRLPSSKQMKKVIEREDSRMAKRYVSSPRHTIQVDYYPYLRTIQRERRRAKRGRLAGMIATHSNELRLGSRIPSGPRG